VLAGCFGGRILQKVERRVDLDFEAGAGASLI
jgi:hypothetical protein